MKKVIRVGLERYKFNKWVDYMQYKKLINHPHSHHFKFIRAYLGYNWYVKTVKNSY